MLWTGRAVSATVIMVAMALGSTPATATPHPTTSTDSLLIAARAAAGSRIGPGSAPTDSLLTAARAAAGQDHHAESIDLYRRIVERDPATRDRVALELARQLTWAGRFDESVAELSGYLGRHPDDNEARLHLALTWSWAGRLDEARTEYREVLARSPDNLDAALGEARMLTWAGRLGAAAAAYRRLVDAHPDLAAPRLGLAQIDNWRGLSRRAWRQYEAIAAGEPKNADAREGLATAQNWVGRPDLALSTLDRMDADGVATASSGKLAAGLRRDLRPHPATRFDSFSDSQDFRLRAVRQEVSLHPTPLVTLAPWVSYRHEERPAEFSIDEVWAGTGASWRLSTGLSMNGSVGGAPSPDPDTDYVPITGDAYVHIEPADGCRWSLAYSHNLYTVLSRVMAPARVDRLVGNSYGFVVAQRIDDRSSLTANYDYSTYSLAGDPAAHFRHNGRIRLRRELFGGKPKIWFDGGYQHIDFNAYAPIGVWTPDRFQSIEMGLDAEWKPLAGLTLSAGLRSGTQREQEKNAAGRLAGNWDQFGGFTAGASGQVGRLSFFSGGGHANSSFETGRGYKRTYGYAGLGWWF